MLKDVLTLSFFALIGFAASTIEPAQAASQTEGFGEQEIRFESGGVTLHGTVLAPDGAGSPENSRKPAVALVHGAGPHTREDQRAEAEAFAREGVVALIYDKRTEGYSQFERSYELLAEDALAAVRKLRTLPEVDPDAVGLWGLSEGAWVVPVAASRPEGRDQVAFVVLVAASGVRPARQHSWNLENTLRHQGVAGSMVEAVSRTGVRLLVGADLFAEAYHDPVGPLEQTRQPVLALWGEKDRIEPPAESARIVGNALKRGGNKSYEIRFFPDADHGLHSSPDGFVVHEPLAPGYGETVASWVTEVARGEEPAPSAIGPTPQQASLSRPLPPPPWWESGWAQPGVVALLVLAFASYPAVALTSSLTRLALGRPREAPGRKMQRVKVWARLLAVAGLAAVLGFVGYFGYLMFTAAGAVGPVVAGRSLPWLALQALAVATVAFTLALGASWWLARGEVGRAGTARIGVLLAGGAVFVAWASYWGLLLT